MIYRLRTAHDEIIEILLAKNLVVEAIKSVYLKAQRIKNL
jgi:hypothetical protein